MKNFKYCDLFAVYGGLLTENQRELVKDYYLCDLSLGEISSIKGVSRQGVLDGLNKAREQLDEYEEKLKFLAKKEALKAVVQGEGVSAELSQRILAVLEE